MEVLLKEIPESRDNMSLLFSLWYKNECVFRKNWTTAFLNHLAEGRMTCPKEIFMCRLEVMKANEKLRSRDWKLGSKTEFKGKALELVIEPKDFKPKKSILF